MPGHVVDYLPPVTAREKPVQITGTRSPAVLHIFLSLSKVSLFVECAD